MNAHARKTLKLLSIYWVVAVLPGYVLPASHFADSTWSTATRIALLVTSTVMLGVALLAGEAATRRFGTSASGLTYGFGVCVLAIGVSVLAAGILGYLRYIAGPGMSAFMGYIAGMYLLMARERTE